MLILLSISLSLDALAVSIAYGLKSTRITWAAKLVICIMSITYFSLSVWLGDQIAQYFSVNTARIIGIVLMGLICAWMLIQVIWNRRQPEEKEAEEIPKTLVKLSIKALGLTFQIIKNPMLSDIDKSNSIGPVEAIFLGTALSIDSISVGIGYSLLGNVHIFAPLMVGGIQFLFLCMGNWAGLKCNASHRRISERLQIVSVGLMFTLVLVRALT